MYLNYGRYKPVLELPERFWVFIPGAIWHYFRIGIKLYIKVA